MLVLSQPLDSQSQPLEPCLVCQRHEVSRRCLQQHLDKPNSPHQHRQPSPFLPSGWHRQQLPGAGTHIPLQAHQHKHTHRCHKQQQDPSAHPASLSSSQPLSPAPWVPFLPAAPANAHTHHAPGGLEQTQTLPSAASTRHTGCDLQLLTPRTHPIAGVGAHIVPTPVAGRRRPPLAPGSGTTFCSHKHRSHQ